MSAIRCAVVFTLMSVTGSLACGVLRPHPRWSNWMIRYRRGSKTARAPGEEPEPGPPCTISAGTPSGLPDTDQYIAVPSPPPSMPSSYGSVAGTGQPRGGPYRCRSGRGDPDRRISR